MRTKRAMTRGGTETRGLRYGALALVAGMRLLTGCVESDELVGVVAHQVFDGVDGASSWTQRVLVTDDNRRIALGSAAADGLAPGQRVRVRGQFAPSTSGDGDVFEIQSVVSASDATGDGFGVVQQGLTLANYRNIVILPYNFSDDTSQPLTQAALNELAFGATSSIKSNLIEQSYGMISSVTGSVQPYVVTTISRFDCANRSKAEDQAWAAAVARGVDLASATNVMYVHPYETQCGSGWIGSALPWSMSRNGAYASIKLTATRQQILNVALHELGHNFGFGHAFGMVCGSATLPTDRASCTLREYGDISSLMGDAVGFSLHYDAPHKAALGWITARQTLTITGPSSFTLKSSSVKSTGYPLVAKIPRPSTVDPSGRTRQEAVYLSLRSAAGADAGMIAYAPAFAQGLSLHLGSVYASADWPWSETYLADATPATSSLGSNDEPLLPGACSQFVTDPVSGLRIRSAWQSVDQIGVTVTAGATCGDGCCEATESRASCAADCAVCGDGVCDAGESCSTDCSVCGNGVCEWLEKLNGNCRLDCGTIQY